MKRTTVHLVEQFISITFVLISLWMFMDTARPLDATPAVLLLCAWTIGASWIS